MPPVYPYIQDVPQDERKAFLQPDHTKLLLVLNALLALLYFVLITFFFKHGNAVLFWILIAGELFHVWQALTFVYMVWDTGYEHPKGPMPLAAVDVFIPVAGEPVDIVEETVRAAQ